MLVSRLVLALVFAVAGLAKLADLPGSRQAVAGFGFSETLARPVGFLLPVAELALAVAFVPLASARFAPVGAAVLVVVFIAAITNAMAPMPWLTAGHPSAIVLARCTVPRLAGAHWRATSLCSGWLALSLSPAGRKPA